MTVFNLNDWTVMGAWPYTPLANGRMETGESFVGVTPVIPAKVPGSIYADLMNAGLIEDPYYERNSLKCEWVSQRWWVYETEFSIPEDEKGKRQYICFYGIDYKAHIFLNGVKLGTHENMYTPFRREITELLKDKNNVKVVIESAPDEMGQVGYTSRTFTQKARFTYNWDFSIRLIGMGLWDRVSVETDGGSSITAVKTKFDGEKLYITADIDENGYNCECEATLFGDEELKAVGIIKNGKAKFEIKVENPKLWYPNGYGEQPLYLLKITLNNENGISDTSVKKIGLRTLEYMRCDGASDDSLPYIPVINGVKIYIKGLNIVPLDHMYGCVTMEDYEKMMKLAVDANANLIRVWGGGIVETEEFYAVCDRLGLMVWQEMIQSSSGIDNKPSEIPEFMDNIASTAEYSAKRLRNHVCLTYYGGGNELMEEGNIPVDLTNRNIAMLHGIFAKEDPEKLFLYSSASGPLPWRDETQPENEHDTHGPWKFEGNEKHYHTFNTMGCQLHGEFGCDGMTNLSSLKKFLSPENLKVTTADKNFTWSHHGSDWWDTYERDKEIFGEIKDLEDYITVSQFMQAESIRYAIESHRRRAFHNCGSIIWQLNEPWPNTSCTNLVDYYGTPKLAYYFFKDAHRPFEASAKYHKLIWNTGDKFCGEVFAHDDFDKGYNSVEVKVIDENGNEIFKKEAKDGFEFEFTVPENCRSFHMICSLDDVKTDYMFLVRTKENPYCDLNAVKEYVKKYRK